MKYFPAITDMISSSVYLATLITLSLAAETCYEGGGDAGARAGGHNIQVTKAMISKPAPDFAGTAVVNGDFTEIKLSDYRGKYLVFFFYPLDFTFVCPTEILAFNDRVKEFRQLGAEVIHLPPHTITRIIVITINFNHCRLSRAPWTPTSPTSPG